MLVIPIHKALWRFECLLDDTGWKEQRAVPEEPILNPEISMAGGGYGQSKWISEQILDTARKETALKAVNVRVGQLAGSEVAGSWNQWEWLPSIVQSYKLVHCLPDATGVSITLLA